MRNRTLLPVAAMGLMISLTLAGCGQTPQPTVQTIQPRAGLSPPTSVPTVSSPPSPTATAATPSPTPELGPLPRVLAEVPLAPPGESVDDLLLDRAAHRLYATDSTGQLHVLDAAAYAELTTLPAAGKLTLDAANHRLYASPTDDPGEVTVVDTDALAVVGAVSPGGFVAVDSAHNRFYVGNRVYHNTPEDAPGVRVYDGATLEKVGEVAQPGIPVYDPLRDELYIVAYTVYAINPDTLDITDDLLPEITAQPLAWCNGCRMATNARVFPDRNLLMVEITELSAGKGPGTYPPPRFFDATTLAELTELADLPPVERGCQRRITLAEPVDGRVYREERYSRYVAFSNLLVYDTKGKLVDWRDGLFMGMTNPNTQQMYVAYPLGILVLDLPTLTPLGRLPPVSCLHSLDAETGRVYAIRDDALVVFSPSGGEYEPPPVTPVDALPTVTIESIHPSPDYAHDHTLFLYYQADQFYRSQDGGQTWVRLQGGLPETDSWFTLGLAVSPDFAHDRTLFAYGYRAEQWGEGVLRSTDGGDAWQPMWNGLTHLRVYDVALSPDYASDGALLAFARYQRLSPWEAGYSVFRSADRGLHWTLLITREQGYSLPAATELLPSGPEPAIRFRQNYADGESVVQRTDDGQTWDTVFVMPPAEQYTTIRAVMSSPSFGTDQTVYVLHSHGLCRSTDGGETWQNWADERLAGRDYSNELTAMALSPSLDGGQHRLFIGTAAGEFWSLDPATMAWEPLPAPAPLPSAATPTVLPAPTAETLAPVTGPYAEAWEQLGGAGGQLGNALAPAVEGSYALQPFEHGLMHWGWYEDDTPYIHVLLYGPDDDPRRGDEWYRYEDTWREGNGEYLCPAAVPPLGPRRGFGKVWCECEECRARLGKPLEQEQVWAGGYQTFEGGVMLWRAADDAMYVLFNRGDWQRVE